jgi:hypothetical protein
MLWHFLLEAWACDTESSAELVRLLMLTAKARVADVMLTRDAPKVSPRNWTRSAVSLSTESLQDQLSRPGPPLTAVSFFGRKLGSLELP